MLNETQGKLIERKESGMEFIYVNLVYRDGWQKQVLKQKCEWMNRSFLF